MRTFYKMSGSGNDFIFVDSRRGGTDDLATPERIRALCARGTGIGADGIVFLESDADADVRIRYFNSDGSVAALCGNATLCTVRLAGELALSPRADLGIATDAGTVRARMRSGRPEFDVSDIARVASDVPIGREGGEHRMGYAVVGVPHLVVEVDDVDQVDVVGRGRTLRAHPWTGAAGANVNFVASGLAADEWRMRTYERGVEGETLACGTGAVASATMLAAWGGVSDRQVRLRTPGGAALDVTVSQRPDGWHGVLRGEGRLVFRGELVDP